MRAPPESFSPITGAPTFIAWSMILQIFSACASDSEPPNTVKSWLNTNTRRPLMVPAPVTTPSPGMRCSAMPNSVQRCSTNMSISSNEPRSSSSSSRSRADSLPRLCWAAIRLAPPPAFAAARWASSRSRISRTDRPSATPSCQRWAVLISPADGARKRDPMVARRQHATLGDLQGLPASSSVAANRQLTANGTARARKTTGGLASNAPIEAAPS